MKVIGPQHGIEAARLREKELHPAYKAAWDKRSDTFLQLIENSNDTITELARIREEMRLRPFG